MIEQPRFRNRAHAGELLADRLEAYAGRQDVAVIALPRGGVPVGFAVARRLRAALGVLLVRKVGLPGNEETAMGAIASGGYRLIQADLIAQLGIAGEAVEEAIRREQAELARREQRYGGGDASHAWQGRMAILVDDGLATGSTMLVALRALKARQPARIVAAVPVASRQASRAVAAEVDEFVCLSTPHPFRAVSLWYDEFGQTSDEEVMRLLQAVAE
ncbi:Predicted phosphoribosyltransferase [Noviherbaspirillum humi]|uniref:Predicted phosphoribosyltransferase n=1 Tax=Noviherbaspirillum humi TaxID=1688639 RepID=A0A239F786_9BURK|nr:phosphoribosyltransferase family protein [Noviherbaspirillum humi]SNS52685.1 Predicted phosphoribosyltransferase [Noviherbaspirillum humi]